MIAQYQLTGATANEIVGSVETGVRTGALAPGAPLPPVRKLAVDLGVAAATVAAAYRSLRQRGVVDTAGRHGTRIRPRPAIAHKTDQVLPEGLVDLAGGEPDPALLPDLSAALRHVPTAPAGYRQAGPCPQLLDLARERFAADGLSGRLTVTGGALDGIDRALSAHLNPGDSVAVEDPCWSNLRDLVAALGMHAVPVPVDDDGPDPDGLAAALRCGVRAAVITSRAHNPTGAVITAGRASRLRAVARDYREVLFVEDDHWAELSQEPLHPVAPDCDNWLFLRSVSKPYGPDLRVALACGDDATVARIEGRMRIGSGWTSTVLQHLVLGLWQDPAAAATVHRARDAYRARREALLAALNARGVAAHGRAGVNIWAHVDDEAHAVAGLRDAGFAVAPGGAYRIASPPGIRLSVSGLDVDGVERLADAVATARLAPHSIA